MFLVESLCAPFKAFYAGLTGKTECCSHNEVIGQEKNLRDNLKENQIDHMIDDSFPASDPPSTY